MATPLVSIPTTISALSVPVTSARKPSLQKPDMLSRRAGLIILAVVTILLFSSLAFIPRIPQPLEFHDFADKRPWLGIPNFGNVISNLPFAIFGIMGFVFILFSNSSGSFKNSSERIPWLFFFLGLFLTAFGSSYYHLHPNNATLVWDRLPMTIAFTSLIAALFAERISLRSGLFALGPLLLLGASSVFYWHLSELRGLGDLRFYFSVQAYSFLMLLLSLFLFSPRYTRTYDLGTVAAFYFAAMLLEHFDRQVFAILRFVSGHTLKHLAASLSGYWLLRMLQLRRPLVSSE
jgi:hypothetical protein